MIFETFFSNDYSLSKMTTESYIRDPRFQAHGCAIKWAKDHKAQWFNADILPDIFADVDWSDTAVICHHAHFDGLILSHHYKVKPKLWLCTLSMARLLLGNHVSVSLDSVRQHFGMPVKRTPYELFKGKHWEDMAPEVQRQVAAGAEDEVESIWQICFRFLEGSY